MSRVVIRYAQWDLARVDVVDPNTGVIVARILPLDKERNADGKRRHLQSVTDAPPPVRSGEPAPLLRKLMQEHAATGLPPGYLPKHERPVVENATADDHDHDHDHDPQRDEEHDR
jgi:hypothetical protein